MELTDQLKMLYRAQGVVFAAAQLCRDFYPSTYAQDILESAGITDEELGLCADYDLKALRAAGLTDVVTDI